MPQTGSRTYDLPITSSCSLRLSDRRLGKNRKRSEYPKKRVEHMTFRLLIRILQFYRIKGEKSEKSECPKKGVENMTFPLLVRILTPYFKAKTRWDYREVNITVLTCVQVFPCSDLLKLSLRPLEQLLLQLPAVLTLKQG